MKKNRPKIIKRKKKTPFAKSKVTIEIKQDPKTIEEKLGSDWCGASFAASLLRMQPRSGTHSPIALTFTDAPLTNALAFPINHT